MAKGRVGQDSVNALQPGERDQFLWDDKLPGFGVKVTPKGAKVYVFQYRMGGRGHKVKRFTIGAAGALKAAKARELAEGLYARVKQGEDVTASAREAKRVEADLQFKTFVERFAETTLKQRWPKSWKLTLGALRRHTYPDWQNKPLPEITGTDVVRLLKKLDHQPAAKRNLYTALSFLFNECVSDHVLKDSPLRGIRPPRQVAQRDRALSDDEIRWLWEALAEEAEPYQGLVQDLLLTGQRRNEVACLPWSELNRQRREWHLPAERAKNGFENIIPLTEAMVARFDKLAGGEKWPRSGLVRASSKKTALSGWSKLKRRLDASMAKAARAAKAEFHPWRLHDLRRTIATNMQRMGIQHEAVEHLLNHREKSRTGIAAVYQVHDYKPEKRRALERWERELGRIIAGEDAKIVPLRQRSSAKRA